MRLNDHYDWVVLGDHPGSLLSGALAARLGFSVLVLPLCSGPRLIFSQSGQYHDPEPNYFLGLAKVERTNGLLLECLHRLGILLSESDKIQKKGVLPQIVTPHSRMAFALDDAEFEYELKREFGENISKALGMVSALSLSEQEILNFWRLLPDRLTLPKEKTIRPPVTEPLTLDRLRKKLERASYVHPTSVQAWFSESEKASSLSRVEGFPETCSGLWYAMTDVDQSDPVLSELIHALALMRTGAAFQGGVSSYRALLIRIAKRLGAHIPSEAECHRVFVEDGRFLGVQILSRGNMITVGGGVVGCSLNHVKERISLSGKNRLQRMKSAPIPQGWRFTLALTVRAEVIPQGISKRILWKESGAPVIEIELADLVDYGVSEPEKQLLFARTQLPFHEESLSLAYQQRISARMFRQLSEIFPFLESHLICVYPDFRSRPEEFKEAYGFSGLEEIPENLRCISGKGVGSQSGVERLFVVSGESFPSLGTLGGAVAAVEATAWLAHWSGLSGPFA